jgi:hypothetical protein
LSWREVYEKGLTQYENGQLVEACGTLHSLLVGQRDYDRPTVTLLARATQALKEPPDHFDPVIELEHK